MSSVNLSTTPGITLPNAGSPDFFRSGGTALSGLTHRVEQIPQPLPGLDQVSQQLGTEGRDFVFAEAQKRTSDPNAWGQDKKMDDILIKINEGKGLAQDEIDYIKMKMEESRRV